MSLAGFIARIGGWRGGLVVLVVLSAWATWSSHLDTIRNAARDGVIVEQDVATRDLERTLRHEQARNLDAAGRGDIRDRLRDPDAPFFADPGGVRGAVTDSTDHAD